MENKVATMGTYARSTVLNANVITVNLTTTLGSYAKSTDLNAYVTTGSLTTTRVAMQRALISMLMSPQSV